MNLELSKCSLRPLTIADAPSLAKYGNTRAIWLNTNLPSPFTPEVASDLLERQLNSDDKVFFAVVAHGEAIGYILLKLQPNPRSHAAEIGYWIGEPYWGGGIGSEIVGAVTRYGFEKLQLMRIFAYVFEWNSASMRVLEKCGYRLEGRLRQSVQKDGRIADEAIYGKLNDNRDSKEKRKVVVTPYDPEWPMIFDRLKTRLEPQLEDIAIALEHVGGTSVPGLAAKPIIDMFVVVQTAEKVSSATRALTELGYVHEGNLGIAGREAFKHPPQLPRHHLYVVVGGSDVHRSDIAFRDYLRAHPDARETYSLIKHGAAEMCADNIDRYIALKAPFVQGILRLALDPQVDAQQRV